MTADDLAAQLLDVLLDADPLEGSMLGLPEYDGRLPDFSRGAQDAVVAALRAVADEAERLDGAGLDEAGLDEAGLDEVGRQTLDLVRSSAAARADVAAVPLVEFTIGDFHGAPVAGLLVALSKVPLDNDDRAEAYLARLHGLASVLEVATGRHLEGLDAGRLPVRRLVEAAVAQLDAYLADSDAGGLRRDWAGAPGFDERVRRALDDAVRPALAEYRAALSERLAPPARDDAHCGLCHLPDGEGMYAALARLHTSTDRTPDELHRTGLDEVARVHEEFAELGGRLWGTTAVEEIFDRLRHDPALRYEHAGEIVDDARTLVARAEEAAPRWFGELPAEACLVEPIPAVEEAGSAPAYYIPGALDGSRQGTYFVNTSRPTDRSRVDAETMAFHEAVPGHHFQLTIAQGQPGLSLARRVLWDTACAEGWGLYSERLADEMGLYSSDLTRLGMLTADAWRAGRLVVDTGIHHFGWSREQAVEWFRRHTALPDVVIGAEVNRYITYPGQALAYMVGRLELVRLRNLASERLGDRFDLRAVHDAVLAAGPLPLPAMAGMVERWIARREPPAASART